MFFGLKQNLISCLKFVGILVQFLKALLISFLWYLFIWTTKHYYTHCYCTRFGIPNFLGSRRNPNQKDFLKFLWGILDGHITGHSHPTRSKKLPKWHFLTLRWNLKYFGLKAFIWSAMRVPFCDFIQILSQAPSKC